MPAVGSAYDASNITFRVLRAFGWGPLLNLGYYRFGKPLTLLNFLATPLIFAPFFRLPVAQLRLVHKSVALLQLGGGRRVLDVGCGRGTSAYVMANAFPHVQVSGVDLLPENVAVARTLYGNTPNLTYVEGDAIDLDFPAGAFDRVLCLEAAFHFPDRRRFLGELARVTAAGARVVILDFMWKNDESCRRCDEESRRLVSRAWQWSNFDSVDEYRRNARLHDFTVEACADWSSHVTAPLRAIFDSVAALSRRSLGRRVLTRYHPLLCALSDDDWREFGRSARAHRCVHEHSQYTALVLRR